MPTSEILLKNKANLNLGWTKCDEPFIGRVIRIGNQKNCNDDSLIVCHYIKNDIEKIFKKYSINDYILNEIKTNYEFSYEIRLKEDVYETFKNDLNNNNFVDTREPNNLDENM